MLKYSPLLLAISMGWLLRMGGPGLILIGLADNSVVPLTGSMDVLTVYLAASHAQTWPYYAFMATLGAVLGGYITFYLARKGGKETLEARFSKRRADKLCKRFENWGFSGVFIPALLPPPFPLVPFLIAAGAMQYSRRKFLLALVLGRTIRYSIVAALAVHYGKPILAFFSRYNKMAVLVLVGLAAVGGAFTLAGYLRGRKTKPPKKRISVAESKTA
jgi:membrane protein YqaA with SNARE-associated domain